MRTGRILWVLIICSITILSCKNNPSSKCGPCPLYATVLPWIGIQLVDKTTGADLFLSPGSPYKLSDLKITSDYTGGQISFRVDSTQSNNRFLVLYAYPSQTFTLKLANFTADNLQVVLKTDSPKCCPVTKLTNVLLNGSSLCNPCDPGQMVVIKK